MRNSHSAPMDCESPSLPAPGHESGDPEAPIGLRAPELLLLSPFLALTAAKHPWVLLCCWLNGQSSALGPQSCTRVFPGSVLPAAPVTFRLVRGHEGNQPGAAGPVGLSGSQSHTRGGGRGLAGIPCSTLAVMEVGLLGFFSFPPPWKRCWDPQGSPSPTPHRTHPKGGVSLLHVFVASSEREKNPPFLGQKPGDGPEH